MSKSNIDIRKLKRIYSIRHKDTQELWISPNGKSVWSTISAAKNAWSCHNFKQNPKFPRLTENCKFSEDAPHLEVFMVSTVVHFSEHEFESFKTDYERGQWAGLNQVLNYLNTLDTKKVDKAELYAAVMEMRPKVIG